MNKPTIIIETVTDSYHIFHANFELLPNAGCQASKYEAFTEEKEQIPILVTEILGIPGVETVVGRPYCVGVHKAFAFAWESIHEKVFGILNWIGENLPVDCGEVDMTNVAPSAPVAEFPEATTTPA